MANEVKITIKNLGRVKINIAEKYGKKGVAALALCRDYAKKAVTALREKQGLEQGKGFYWTNQTRMAIEGVKGFVEKQNNSVGFGLMHTMEYGRWLEFRNNRKDAALEPTIREIAPAFYDDVRKIYAK
jgi:hypothetical protein